MGRPKVPTTAQWIQMRDASALSLVDSSTITLAANGTYTSSFPMRKYSASLIVISDPTKIAIRKPAGKVAQFYNKINAKIVNSALSFSIPTDGLYDVSLLNSNGVLVFKGKANGKSASSFALKHIGEGTFFLKCANADYLYNQKVVTLK
jgi:acid phosphatase family membrane protein YuiD